MEQFVHGCIWWIAFGEDGRHLELGSCGFWSKNGGWVVFVSDRTSSQITCDELYGKFGTWPVSGVPELNRDNTNNNRATTASAA